MAPAPPRSEQSTPTSASPGAGPIPLLYAACLFATGIASTQFLYLRPSWLLIALVPLAALSVLAALRTQRIAWLPLGILWLVLGAWCAQMEPHPTPAPALAALSDGLLRTVEGTVVDTGPLRDETEQNLPDNELDHTPSPALPAPSQSIDLRVSSLEVVTDAEDTQTPIQGAVRLTVRWPSPQNTPAPPHPFQCGDHLRALVRLLPPAVYHDPNVWSRQDFLLDQGITSTSTVTVEKVERLGSPRDFLPACRLHALQHATTTRLLALPAAMRGLPSLLRLSPDDTVMLAAMVTGDRTFLTRSLRVGFERTGSFHMLVVSGFHLAIVAACLFWIARRLRLPRIPATLLTLLASLAYALFTGFATPVQRSLLVVTLYLLGRLVYRQRSPLNTIGFAALCLLAASPRSLFDASLQMTLLAVVSIAGIAAPLLQSTVHPYLTAAQNLNITALDPALPPKLAHFRFMLRFTARILETTGIPRLAWQIFPALVRLCLRFLELFIVSCVVELAMTLPMALYFHRITLFALPVNIFILPLLLVLMPAALLTLAALALWPAAAIVPAMVVAFFLHLGVGLVRLFSSFTFADIRIPAPLLAQSALFCALLALSIYLARRATLSSLTRVGDLRPEMNPLPDAAKVFRAPSIRRTGAPADRSSSVGWIGEWVGKHNPRRALFIGSASRWPRRAAFAAVLLAAIAAVLPRPIEHPRNALLVEAIDVGQGDSILLITPDGRTLLIDGGGFGGGPRQAPQSPASTFDIGEEVVSEALWTRGIRHLDAVALTHAHSDHMGGLPAVLRNFHPAQLWIGNNPRIPAYVALLAESATLHTQVRQFRSGDQFPFGLTRVSVLAPFPNYQPGPEPTNNDSLVLHVAFGQTSVLLEGDAEAPIEEEMVAQSALPGHALQSTLLKVGHHGSLTSTRPAFLARVAPQWAVISCGLRNRYGHPRQPVLEELQHSHVRTWRTDIHGDSCFLLTANSAAPLPCTAK